MKISLSNLTDALVFLLRGLYDAERKLQKAIPPCAGGIRSEAVRRVVDNYYDSAGNKILKLERVFNYLMTEPQGRSHEVMEKMIDDTNRSEEHTSELQSRENLVCR